MTRSTTTMPPLDQRRMLLNVIHRADRGATRLEALRFQQDEAHRHGLKTTILVTYGALFEPDVIEYVRGEAELHGTELGIHFHELVCDDYRARFQTDEKAIYLLPTTVRWQVIRFLFVKFQEVFAFIPTAVGSYILDAATLNFLRAEFPSVGTAIITCFEEGIKMYHGNNRQWHLFSDGGPWGMYAPSRDNHHCPALTNEDANGIVGLPHLNRDMVLSLTSRDDLFASHPANLIRAKANVGAACNYVLHFIDQWIEQLQYNGHVYYSLFVSPPWLSAGHPFATNPEESQQLYTESLAYLKSRKDAGLVEDLTMTEAGEWYRSYVPSNQPEVNLWNDILCGTGRQTAWYVDAYLRVAIDLNAGGSICDLRPLIGRVDCNMGADTAKLWNGNYPYLISSEHRGGVTAGPVQTCEVTCCGRTVSFTTGRVKATVTRPADGPAVIETEPMKLRVGDVVVTVVSVFRMSGGGAIEVERRLVDVSDSGADIEFTELHRGCWGTTEYPEDMRGIELEAVSPTDERHLTYAYGSRVLEVRQPRHVGATIPQVKCRVTLGPINGADRGSAQEGFMFQPFYTLRLCKSVKPGESLTTCLTLHHS